jgi:hypothetical protein
MGLHGSLQGQLYSFYLHMENFNVYHGIQRRIAFDKYLTVMIACDYCRVRVPDPRLRYRYGSHSIMDILNSFQLNSIQINLNSSLQNNR